MSETIDLAALTAANVADGDSLLGINGNSLKKVKVENENGSICKFFDFPGANALVAAGYLDEANKSIPNYYIPAVVKNLADTNPKGGLFIGKATPGERGILFIYTYSGKAENGSGLPPYGSGIYIGVNACYFFRIANGVFYFNSIDVTSLPL